MTSSRRIAFSFVLAAACSGVLLAFLPPAKGQNTAAGSGNFAAGGGNFAAGSGNFAAGSPGSPGFSSAPSAAGLGGASAPAGTGSPALKHVIGISPVQTGTKQLIVLGGTGAGDDTYDPQNENIYSLLRQRGVDIPNVLHPYSTAKPSFIVERLIVLSLTGGSGTSTSGGTNTPDGGRGSSSGSGSTGEGGAAQVPAGPTAVQNTISEVRRYVDAEISRGTGRLGGAHLRKLLLLSDAIAKLETANTIGTAIDNATGGGTRGGDSAGGTGGSTSKIDPKEILYGQVRLTARKADLYVPVPSSYERK